MTDLSQDWRLHRHSLTAHSLDEAHQAHQRPAHAVPGLRCCLLVASVREKWMRCGAGCGTLIIIRDTTVQSPSLPSWGCELSSTRAPLLQSCQSNVASSHQCDSPQLIPHPSSSPASQVWDEDASSRSSQMDNDASESWAGRIAPICLTIGDFLFLEFQLYKLMLTRCFID